MQKIRVMKHKETNERPMRIYPKRKRTEVYLRMLDIWPPCCQKKNANLHCSRLTCVKHVCSRCQFRAFVIKLRHFFVSYINLCFVSDPLKDDVLSSVPIFTFHSRGQTKKLDKDSVIMNNKRNCPGHLGWGLIYMTFMRTWIAMKNWINVSI